MILKYFFIFVLGCVLTYLDKWLGIDFFYMAMMISIHSKKSGSLRNYLQGNFKLILRYLFVFVSSYFALTHSKQWGLIYLSIATYLVTSDLFEKRQ